MGEVYRAHDLILNQAVALKFLVQGNVSEAALARFRNEVRIARQVSHPNVCRVYDIGFIGGSHFLSMEYVDGEDLASQSGSDPRATRKLGMARCRPFSGRVTSPRSLVGHWPPAAAMQLATPGGADVGAFNSTTIFPASFTATNFSNTTVINRSQPLTFNWSGTGIDQVAIVLTSSVTAGGVVHITTLNCNVPSGPGSYTVPAEALARLLPAAASGAAFGSVSIQGVNTQGKFTANLTKGGQLDFGTFWSEIGVGKNIAVQ